VTEWRWDWGIYIVWKDLLKNKLRANLELWMLKWSSFMRHLRSEFEMYSEETSDTRKFWHHFDLLSCVYMLNRWAEKAWYFIKDEVSVAQKRLEGDFDWMDESPADLIFADDADPYERMAKFWW
jgi:hypothetical protein